MNWYWWLLVCLAVGLMCFIVGAAVQRYTSSLNRAGTTAYHLAHHFFPKRPEELVVAAREFPIRVRADIQRALDEYLRDVAILTFTGVQKANEPFGFSFSALIAEDENSASWVAPPQFDDVDIGEDQPVRCVKEGFWLVESGGVRGAILVSQLHSFTNASRLQVSVAVARDEDKVHFSDCLFNHLEATVKRSPSYRGKVLTFEKIPAYTGEVAHITVQRLRKVRREDVILPPKTLDLLDRNVLGFIKHRAEMVRLGQPARKGLLFYGPPGNGKTHTLHYLFGALPDHTTLVIPGEQVEHLTDYMALARLLQPSIVVLEDADLIGRNRGEQNTCENMMLNRLLNEMDGLREDAQVLFILTTNRPQALEPALAARPGRIDQAIEFPRPDSRGREQLIRLYSGGVNLSSEVIASVVARTESTSAVFLKELMRRGLQCQLERGGSGDIALPDIDTALDDMLLSGGSLNQSLLGVEMPGRRNGAIL